MRIEIDPASGFCFGVVRAIRMAERELQKSGELACLGDIVHNNEEIERLETLGLRTIYHEQLTPTGGTHMLFRAHGEPPETYRKAEQMGIRVIDATCPVVLQLQKRVHLSGEKLKSHKGQIVIYGKKDHAEVVGLLGQTDCARFVIRERADLAQLDFTVPIECFSQTTMNPQAYEEICEEIRERMRIAQGTDDPPLTVHQTTCSQVSNRREGIAQFARAHDAVLFVSGKKSSNGKMLYHECLAVNARTHFISKVTEIESAWLEGVENLGICGATSTPKWLMKAVAEQAERLASIRDREIAKME